jgi:hypothetical protein
VTGAQLAAGLSACYLVGCIVGWVLRGMLASQADTDETRRKGQGR